MTKSIITANKIRQCLMVLVLSLVLAGAAAFPLSAEPVLAGTAQPATQATPANPEIPITGVTFPENVSLKVGESKTLAVKVSPSNTTYLTNIEWGYQTNSCFTVKVNGFGTYWKGQPSTETLTGTKAGKGYLNVTVKVFDSTGKSKGKFDVRTVVNVSGTATQPTTTKPTQPTTTKPTQPTTTRPTQPTTTKPTQPTTTRPTQPTTTRPTQTTTRTVSLSSIYLSKTSMTLNPGKKGTLTVGFNPSNTTVSKTVTWTSSNSSVAKVDRGQVTAVKAGSATITATCNGKKATCKVTVKPAEQYKNVSEAYTLLNTFRTTKSNQWYWKSDNKHKQWVTGLKKLKKDTQLEKVAKLRAKEAWIMYYDRGKATHTRPNGKAWSTAYPKNMNYKAENLAWGYSTCKSVVTDADGWAETNEKYGGQGHRRNMLSKSATKVGIACYEKDGQTCWCMALGK